MMTDEEKEALRDRFSGYQLPKIDLDAGFPVYQVPVHPYFYNQPLEWTKPAYTKYETTGPQLIGGDYSIGESGYSSSQSSHGGGGTEIAGSSGSSSAIIRGSSSSRDGKVNQGPRTDLLPF